jgi:hypothetical protein
MKKFLSIAAVALLSTAGAAQADTFSNAEGSIIGSALGLNGRYSDKGAVLGNIEAATPTVTNKWTITGNVSKDCSFFGGSQTGRTLDLGTIGVNTQANTGVNRAFNMVAPAAIGIATSTAGCNFKNKVSISKNALGLRNTDAQGYDTNEFQANIPYTVVASFIGSTNQSGPAAGTKQTLTVAQNSAGNEWNGGAWRSSFSMAITAAAPDKGLVAGTYSDDVTVVLAAL